MRLIYFLTAAMCAAGGLTALAAAGWPGPVQPAGAESASGGSYPRPAAIHSLYLPVFSYSIPESMFGVQMYGITEAQGLRYAKAAGVSFVRFEALHWDEIEPVRTVPPSYHWETVDEASLLAGAGPGMRVIALVLFAPDWAQRYPGVRCGPIAAEAFGAYAEFLAAAARRYGGYPFNVKYWELGNEPDVSYALVPGDNGYGCWGEEADPYYGGGYYGQMLAAVSPVVKAADPEAQVLIGGLLLDCNPIYPPPGRDCRPSLFLEGILAGGGGPYFDAVSFHAYSMYHNSLGMYGNSGWYAIWDLVGPSLIPKSQFLRGVLQAYGQGAKPLLNTEVALLCGSPDYCDEDFERTKAFYVAQAYSAALAEGLAGNVWYTLADTWRKSGLLYGGTPTLAYHAYAAAQDRLAGAEVIGPVTPEDVGGSVWVRGYRFSKADREMWVLWAVSTEPAAVVLELAPAAGFDLYGTPFSPAAAFDLTMEPVYLEFP